MSPALRQAINLPIYSAAVIPVLVGTAAAWAYSGRLDPGRFLLTLLGLVLVQVGINFQNDYFDAQTGVDKTKEDSLVQVWNPSGVLTVFLMAFALALGIAFYLQSQIGGTVLLTIVLSGGLLGFFYSAPPLRLSYHSLGELVTFVCFGPLAVLGAYVVQTGELARTPFLASLPVGFLVTAILYVHHFPQQEGDQKYGKKSAVVRLGRRRAADVFLPFILIPYFGVGLLVAISWLPPGSLLFWVTVPFALKIARDMRKSAGIPGQTPSKYAAVTLHFTGGVALSLGLLLDRLL